MEATIDIKTENHLIKYIDLESDIKVRSRSTNCENQYHFEVSGEDSEGTYYSDLEVEISGESKETPNHFSNKIPELIFAGISSFSIYIIENKYKKSRKPYFYIIIFHSKFGESLRYHLSISDLEKISDKNSEIKLKIKLNGKSRKHSNK